MATVYKSFDYKTEAKNRPVTATDTDTTTALNNIVASFVTLFKAKHT